MEEGREKGKGGKGEQESRESRLKFAAKSNNLNLIHRHTAHAPPPPHNCRARDKTRWLKRFNALGFYTQIRHFNTAVSISNIH